MELKCQLCGKVYTTYTTFTVHVKKKHADVISLKEYYLRYINPDPIELCLNGCGKEKEAKNNNLKLITIYNKQSNFNMEDITYE